MQQQSPFLHNNSHGSSIGDCNGAITPTDNSVTQRYIQLPSTQSFHWSAVSTTIAMATRGVFQCKKLTLYYCEHGGSSQAARDYLNSKQLIQWAKDRPSVEIRVRVRNGKHPYIKAEYLSAPFSHHTSNLCEEQATQLFASDHWRYLVQTVQQEWAKND
jgi:hypothetical protein